MTYQATSVGIWMPWHLKDHLARASTLSHQEHSVLCYLRMLLWQHGGQIVDDDRWIARRVRLTLRQWQSMKAIVTEDCTVAGGRITNSFLAAEHAKAIANVEQKKKAGKASAAARAAKSRGEQNGNTSSTGVPTVVQPRAGGGAGPTQGCSSGDSLGDNPFRVVPGGAR